MPDFPECLQPAVQQLEKYERQIADLENTNGNLDDDLKVLSSEKEELNKQLQEEQEAHSFAVQTYEKEKLTLRELNIVVSDQLREKVAALNALNASKTELEEENGNFKSRNSELSEYTSQVSVDSERVNREHEALSVESDAMKHEIEKLRIQNKALQEENSALTLVNSAMHQRQSDNQAGPTAANDNSSALLEEIESLRQQLSSHNPNDSESSFLLSENQRLTQRHGEITQEKMYASARMHAAEQELTARSSELEKAFNDIKQLKFEQQGLQNLYKNLSAEKDRLALENSGMKAEKEEHEEQIMNLSEQLQMIKSEKDRIGQELSQEYTKTDILTEEVNHLRMKSRVLAEEIKGLKEGILLSPKENTEPQIEALEIDMTDVDVQDEHPEIEMVPASTKSGPHFPGE